MSYDALFQLGMGPVLLDASQTEEILATHATKPCAEAICFGNRSHRFGLAAFAMADQFRAEKKSRGNSAKALILSAGPAAASSNA